MERPALLDGAMGTTLQEQGLPLGQAADGWVVTRPEAVRRVHEAFVEAGAASVCTATLSSLPGTPGWREQLQGGVALARQAAGERAEVWLSLGPGSGHGRAVGSLAEAPDGVVLETFLDASEGLAALAEVRAAWSGAVVLSIVPDDAGQVRAGPPLDELVEQARALGASGLGFNCMSVAAALRAARRASGCGLPLWAKPSGGYDDPPTWRALAREVRWLGGCCGMDPHGLARLRIDLAGPSTRPPG